MDKKLHIGPNLRRYILHQQSSSYSTCKIHDGFLCSLINFNINVAFLRTVVVEPYLTQRKSLQNMPFILKLTGLTKQNTTKLVSFQPNLTLSCLPPSQVATCGDHTFPPHKLPLWDIYEPRYYMNALETQMLGDASNLNYPRYECLKLIGAWGCIQPNLDKIWIFVVYGCLGIYPS